jgi:hypothetical protein
LAYKRQCQKYVHLFEHWSNRNYCLWPQNERIVVVCLNQLAKHANAGRMVTVNNDLLRSTTAEVQRLREALLGSSGGEE